MKPYYLASERAAAPTSSMSYIAPVLTRMWFRWDGIRDSGYNRTGAEAVAESGSKPVQVFCGWRMAPSCRLRHHLRTIRCKLPSGGGSRMKIKSRVWYWLAAASGAVSLLYGMGIEGGAQLGSSISDSQFVTALCLVLAAVAFLRLGFAAQDREQNARRYGRVDRTHARTEEPDYRQNRRGA